MNDYEKKSQEANEFRKSIGLGKEKAPHINVPGDNQGTTFVKIMGIIFIVIGIIGSIAIMFTFDWDTYNVIKDRALFQDETALMRADLINTWTMAGLALIGNLAIGSVLLALDQIIQLLKRLSKQGVTKS